MRTMKAAVFVKPGKIVLDEKPVPKAGPGEALVKITTTTICGTDVHILKGEYPVASVTPVWTTIRPSAAVMGPMAGKRWEAGNSATRSTAVRPNMCWCRTPWPIWNRFRTI